MRNYLKDVFQAATSLITRPVADIVDPSSIKKVKYPFNMNPPSTRTALSPITSYAVEQTQDYDLASIDRFIDSESMVFQAFSKIEEKAMNGGWQFVSKDQNALDYIRQRFTDMAGVTDKPLEIFLRETIQDLIRYSNCFLFKLRDKSRSSGRGHRDLNGNLIEPVAAYIRIDPTSVVPVRDKRGNIFAYDVGITSKQSGMAGGIVVGPGRYVKRIPASEIVHMYAFKNPRNNLGTPYIWPVRDDIRVLRKMEENVELLLQRHIFPLFHYIVGTETAPALPEEIEKITYDLELMPTEGGFVTPERHKIEVLGAEGAAIDAAKYLGHFQERVIIGLGIGAVSLGLGGGASRASSEVIDRSLVEKAKLYQELFCAFLEDSILKELLVEGGFEVYDVTKYIPVHLRFDEIDTDLLIKKQTHIVNMFNNQLLSHNESRQEIGRDIIEENGDEWQNLQFFTFGVAKQSEYQIQVNNAIAKDKRAEGAKTQAASQNGPSNQHGKNLSPKRARDFVSVTDGVIRYLKNSDHADRFGSMLETRYEDTRKDILQIAKATPFPMQSSSSNAAKLTFGLAKTTMEKASYSYIYESFSMGLMDAAGAQILNSREQILDSRAQDVLDHYNHYLSKTMTNLEKDVMNIMEDQIGPSETLPSDLTSLFDVRKHYINRAAVTGIAKAYNYGKALGFRNMGHEKAYMTAHEDSCTVCLPLNGQEVDIRYINPDSVPPHHGSCECTIEITKADTNGQVR